MPVRFGTWFWGCGITRSRWLPKQIGSDYEMPIDLAPITAHRSNVAILTGFNVALDGVPNSPHITGNLGLRTGVPVPESGKPHPLGPARPNPGTPGCSQAPWTRPSRQVGPGARISGYHASIGPGRVPGRPMRCRQAAPHHAACRRPVSLPWGLHKGSAAERRTRGAPPGRTAPAKGGDHHPRPPAAERPPKHEKGDPKVPFPSSSPP